MNPVKRSQLKRHTHKRNRLHFELLEDRRLLTAAPAGEAAKFDVNQDGHVTAVDALQVINFLSQDVDASFQALTTVPPTHDVNRDGNVTSVDALQIINFLNETPGSESSSSIQSEPNPAASVSLPAQIRSRDVAELTIDSFSDLDLSLIDRIEIDWGDDRITTIPKHEISAPQTRLHSYFVSPGPQNVEVRAVTHDGSAISLANSQIETVANSPSIVDRVDEGLTAEIFDNATFTGPSVRLRTDPTIAFDFGIDGPDPNLNISTAPFSILWHGFFTPDETASYAFFADVGTNDVASIYVDNQLLFTATGNEQSASIPLTAGESVELRIDYVAGLGQSHIRVGSETDSSFRTALPSHQLRPIISAEQLRSGALIETFEAATLITSVEDLQSSESFIANSPAAANDLAGLTYSQPAGTHATRTRSIVSVPVSGAYTFHVAASDTAEVYLSQEVASDTSRVIMSVANAAPPEDFTSPNANASTPIYLVAGQDYYIETLHAHDNASTAGHLAVAWTRPDQPELGPQLIDTAFLRPIVPEVTLHADVSQTHEADVVSRNARFVIARSDDLGRDLDVAYTLGGSAINGVDYSQLSGIATIPAGQDHVFVELDPVDDATLEGSEVAIIRLASDPRYQLGVESQRQIQITIAGELQNETQLLPQDIPTLINTGFTSTAGSNQITTFHVDDTNLPFVDGSPSNNAIRAVVTTATPDSPWDTLVGYGFDGSPYPAGTPFFASVWARSGNIDGSNATVGLRLQKSSGDYAGEEKVWQVGPEWTLLLLPMTPDFGNGTSDRTVDVRMGYQEQIVELGGFSLVKLDLQTDLDAAPKPIFTYGGREWDAEWREQAAIEAATHRTNPIQIKIVDASGNPIEGAVVTITPTTPSLPIGTAVSPELIVASNPDSLTPEAQRYQAILEMFDTITDGGTAQWGPWSLDPPVPRDFLNWVIERELPYHGHALVWGDFADDPSDNFPTPVSLLDGYNHQLSTNGAAAAETWLENEILTHVSTTGPANDFSGSREDSSKPRVTWWDVINHPIFAPEIWDIVGYDFIVDILQATRNTVDSDTELIINEFDILSNPDNGQSDAFFDLLTLLDTTANVATGENAQYDAIGFQGHFVSNRLPSIDRIMEELDRYEVFDRNMQITEFDVDAVDIDQQTQADFTRDFYQTLSATPNLTAATLWGIWSGDHWRETPTNPESAALFNTNFTPRPNGQWLLESLNTSKHPTSATTNSVGESEFRNQATSAEIKVVLPSGQSFNYSTEIESRSLITLLAPDYVINSEGDLDTSTIVVDGTCDDGLGNCTLREAILEANANPGIKRINFAIPGPGPHVISLASDLPTITDAVIIDGTTEPDYSGTPVVQIDGSSAVTDGLRLAAGDSTIKGLAITNFPSNGILVLSDNNTIEGNYIGTDTSGAVDAGNGQNGIFVNNASGNLIGGLGTEGHNVISGNDQFGVYLLGVDSTGNTVQGNHIGTDATGLNPVG
ncbi:PA14 domain-containing protein, partial [Aporhodopirellula rubra]